MATERFENLESFRVNELPDAFYYIPNFITAEEEVKLLRHIYEAPKPKWTQLSNRRLQNWGGLPHHKGMVPEPIPQWLSGQCESLRGMKVFGADLPNHVLVNEYLAGQGIMPHTDGPLYQPMVAIISLSTHTVMNFYRPITDSDDSEADISMNQSTQSLSSTASPELSTSWSERYIGSVLLEPRSLILFSKDLYTRYLHAIDETTEDIIDERIKNLHLLAGLCSDQGCPHYNARSQGAFRFHKDSTAESVSNDSCNTVTGKISKDSIQENVRDNSYEAVNGKDSTGKTVNNNSSFIATDSCNNSRFESVSDHCSQSASGVISKEDSTDKILCDNSSLKGVGDSGPKLGSRKECCDGTMLGSGDLSGDSGLKLESRSISSVDRLTLGSDNLCSNSESALNNGSGPAAVNCCDRIHIGDTLTRSTRVSLTIRVVKKVIKAKLIFGRK